MKLFNIYDIASLILIQLILVSIENRFFACCMWCTNPQTNNQQKKKQSHHPDKQYVARRDQ